MSYLHTGNLHLREEIRMNDYLRDTKTRQKIVKNCPNSKTWLCMEALHLGMLVLTTLHTHEAYNGSHSELKPLSSKCLLRTLQRFFWWLKTNISKKWNSLAWCTTALWKGGNWTCFASLTDQVGTHLQVSVKVEKVSSVDNNNKKQTK